MPDLTVRPSFPFFMGCGRSGTTLVRAMFGAHPEMAIPPGTRLVKQWARTRGEYDGPDGFDAARFGSDLERSGWLERWDDGPEPVRAALSASAPADLPDAIRLVYATFAASQGKPRYGNKSHGYVVAIPMIASLLPEAKFIHIIRDGRNVALSLVEAPFGPKALAPAAHFWAHRVHKGRADGLRLGADRYREVRYEDLVADPESQLRPLCGFLGLPFDDVMLRYYENEARPSRGLQHPEIHRNLTQPPVQNIRDWRTQMSAREVAQFEAIAGAALEEFGYQRSRDIPWRYRAEQRVRGSLSRTRAGVGRARHTARETG